MPDQPPVWDLRDLYESPDDPLLSAHAVAALEGAARLARDFAGRLAELTPEDFARLVKSREEVLGLARMIAAYARLHGAAEGHGPESEALRMLAEDVAGRVNAALRFFKTEWTALPEERADALAGHPAVAAHARELALMRLGPAEPVHPAAEEAVEALAPILDQARRAMYESALARGGRMSITALASGLQSPDRRERTRAARLLAPRLEALAPWASALLSMTVRERTATARLKNLAHPWEEDRAADEIRLDHLERTVGAVLAQSDLARRHLALKRRLLGLARLGHADLVSSMPGAGGRISWKEARARLEASFSRVSPETGRAARAFLDNPWIHARPLPGKELGAFCLATVPKSHPYLFMSWGGTDRCLALLAHELGHGAHQLLSSPAGLFSLEPPFFWAEAVACFFELVLGLEAENRARTRSRRLAALAQMLQSAFILVFRQAALLSFEHALYADPDTALPPEALGRLWAMCLGRVYGRPARVKGYARHWILVPHFLRLPGKVGDYVPAGLLGLAMFRNFQNRGEAYGERVCRAMASGRTKAMADILDGLDLPAPGPKLAEQGLDAFAALLGRAEALL